MSNFAKTSVILIIATVIFALGHRHTVNADSALSAPEQGGYWSIANQNYGNQISMLSSNDGWIIAFDGNTANLYHWNGTTWTSAGTVSHNQYIVRSDIHMVSPDDGWIILGGPLGGSSNLAESSIYRWNGSSWILFNHLTDPYAVSLWAIDMLSATDGWATAAFNFGSFYYHWDGNTWQKTDTLWLPVTGDNDIDMLSATNGWSVGFEGHIIHWNGNTWSQFSRPVTTSLNSIDMISATSGWTVGAGGVILRWNGEIWSLVTSPVTTTLNSVSMVSETDGWAVGGGWNGQDSDPGVILHWDGDAWTEVPCPTTDALNAVAMTSSTDGWIAGDSATLRYAVATLNINHASGQPGSYFNIVGSGFPPTSTVQIDVNGYPFNSTMSTNASGVFTSTLSTGQAGNGFYIVTASVNPIARTSFTLDPAAPLQSRVGDWTIFDIPPGIAFTQVNYLPLIIK